MKIAIAGGTGLVGSALTKELVHKGHDVYILTRSKKTSTKENIHYIQWLQKDDGLASEMNNIDIFVNLAGASINGGRWTEKRKEIILNSRLESTQEIVRIIKQMETKPKALIQASAVGFYGTSLTESFTEDDTEAGYDFLALTVLAWENAAKELNNLGIRTVFTRFGIILDENDGALPTMALPYRLFGGGKIGSGKQWISWIHLTDVVRGIIFSIENENMTGPANFTAPHPVKMDEFGQALGKALKRPHWFPVPAFLLKTMLGEMSILVVEGQQALPKKLEDNGFQFEFPTIEPALRDIYQTNS